MTRSTLARSAQALGTGSHFVAAALCAAAIAVVAVLFPKEVSR